MWEFYGIFLLALFVVGALAWLSERNTTPRLSPWSRAKPNSPPPPPGSSYVMQLRAEQRAAERAKELADLRDDFAAQALPRVLADYIETAKAHGGEVDLRDLAEAVWGIADELMAARESRS